MRQRFGGSKHAFAQDNRHVPIQACHLFFGQCFSADHNHRYLAGRFHLLHRFQHTKSIQLRHHQIQQDQIGLAGLEKLQGFPAAGGQDNLMLRKFGPDDLGMHIQHAGIIIHNQYRLAAGISGILSALRLDPAHPLEGFHQLGCADWFGQIFQFQHGSRCPDLPAANKIIP